MSGLNCRPGDMAVICRAPAEPANFGVVLTVTRIGLPGWWVFADASRPVCAWDGETGDECRVSHSFEIPGRRVLVGDDELMPLRPPPADESTTTDADKPVEVT